MYGFLAAPQLAYIPACCRGRQIHKQFIQLLFLFEVKATTYLFIREAISTCAVVCGLTMALAASIHFQGCSLVMACGK